MAGIGPVSINTGSSPTTLIATNLAIGSEEIFFSPASLHTIIAAAPSVIWLALPAVITPPSVTVLNPARASNEAS